MTETDDPIRRRRSYGPKPRETIEELYGDVLAPKPIGLFDIEDAPDGPPHRDAAFSELAEGGAAPPPRAYHAAAEGAPGGFKRSGRLAFPRKGGDLTAIVLSHGLLTLLTLGIWRFWQVSAQRRSVWSHTKLAGEPFEYRGTGLEMFIGAAAAAVVLAAALLVWQMALGWLGFSAPPEAGIALPVLGVSLSLASLTALLPLIELARFRARRYRLRRTRWRGIRFDMRGAGLGIVAIWAIWALATIATLGLAAPFLSTARERYMTERTVWGAERFFFRGSAWRLMPSWAFIWLLLMAPVTIAGAHVWDAVERAALAQEIAADAPVAAPDAPADADVLAAPATPDSASTTPAAPDTEASEPAPPAPPQAGDIPADRPVPPPPPADAHIDDTPAMAAAAALAPWRDRIVDATRPILGLDSSMQTLLTLGWAAALVLGWFDYRAARIRMFMNARRIAGARARCTFGARALLEAWLAVIGRSIWPGLPVYVLIAAVAMIPLFSIDRGAAMSDGPWEVLFGEFADWRARGLVLMALALNYGLSALFAMWLADVVWFRAVWHKLCASTHVEGLETLEHVRQRPAAAAADADGLADAFDIDVGL